MATFKTPSLDPATGRLREKHVPTYLTPASQNATYVPNTAKGAASGVASLDTAGKPVEERVYAPAAGRPRKPLVTTLITQFATGHGWTNYTSSAASFTDDTTTNALGTQSVQSVTKTDNTPAQVQGGGYAVNATGKMVVIWLKVDGVANLTELNLYAGDASLANSYNWTIADAGGVAQHVFREGEWMPVVLGFADAIAAGSPNRASLNLFRLRSRATTGNAVTVHIGGLGLTDEPNAFPNGVISISCDDSYLSQYVELRKALDVYGWGATAYTIVDRLGVAGFMTLAQLKDLEQNHNWEVAGHSYTMANHAIGYGNMTDADCEADIRNLKKWLVDNNFRGADHLAYPLGSFTPSTQAVMGKYFSTGRTVTNRLIETIRPSDRMRLRSLSVTNTITLATAKAMVDKVVANKGWGILTFHELVTTPTLGAHWAIADMIALIDYIATKGVPVMPVGEVSSRLQNPDAVSSTASVLTTATANIGAIVHAALGNAPGKLNALRRQDAAAGIATTAGKVDIITFSPTLDMTITKLSAMTSGTAWTGHTLARMGLYTVDTAGVATLVAQTAADATLFLAAQTAYQKSLDTAGGYPASYTLLAGQRYAVGIIGVGQTAGQLRGGTSSSVLAQRTPVMGGTLGTGLTDLPTTGTIAATGNYPWAEVAA
jgi:hypothetical protein